MRLSRIQKKVASLSLAAFVGIAGCSVGAGAYVTRGPYNFSVSVGGNDTSGEVQKTTDTHYAYATVDSYGNSTNKNYLRLRTRRGGNPVSDFVKVTGVSKKYLNYNTAVAAGQSLRLRGFVADGASYGYGVMAGTFTP